MRYKFADIAESSVAKRLPTEEDRLLYIGLEHLESGSLSVSRWGSPVSLKGEKLIMKKGDILFGKRNTYLRRASIAPHDGLFSAHGMILRPKTSVVCEEYFPFFVNSEQFFSKTIQISVGSLSPTVNWKDMRELEFDLPPIEKQRKLAELLWAANDLKEKYKKLITASDEMLKAKFREMFGDRVPNELKWEHRRADEVFEISSSRRVLKNEWISSGIPFLRVRDMVAIACGEKLQNEFFVSKKFYDALGDDDGKVRPGDILVSATSTIGKCYVVKEGDAFYYKDADILRYRKKIDIDSDYFIYALQMPTLRDQVMQTVGGTTVGHFLICKAKGILIPLPPLDLQRQFVEIAAQEEKVKANLKKSIADVDNIIKGLING